MTESLYIHIPFCIKKCVYCDFLSIPYTEAVAAKYIDALCRELQLKRSQTSDLATIFMGGGTPTTLSAEGLTKIFDCVRNNFGIKTSAEITVEANPGTITEHTLDTLVSLGVNRISMGVQSFQNSELLALGRIHDSDEAIRSAEMITSSGIENLSLDLIYGIPGQSMQTWLNSLEKALALQPRHISAYELTPEHNTPLWGLLEAGSLSMLHEDQIIEMQDSAIDRLEQAGFDRYEISNYSVSGYSCRHNLNYWNQGQFLGAGAGASGFVHGFRSKNTNDIHDYIERLGADIIPVTECTAVSEEDAKKELIFLGLRKTEGVSLSQASRLGVDLADASSKMIQEGHMEIAGDSIRITGKGFRIANTVMVSLLQNLGL